MDHWPAVQQLAVQARSTRHASARLDDAIFCSAIYVDTPIHFHETSEGLDDWFTGPCQSLATSGIFYEAPRTDENVLLFSVSLAYDDDTTALHHVPFLAYSLDEESLVDMLWGRLFFFVAVNLGKVIEQLRNQGFDIIFDGTSPDDPLSILRVSTPAALRDGSQGRIELQNITLLATKMHYDFVSLDGFINLVQAALDSLLRATQNLDPNTSATV